MILHWNEHIHPPEFVDLAKWAALAVAQEAGLPQSSPMSMQNLIII